MQILNPDSFWLLILLVPLGALSIFRYTRGKAALRSVVGSWRFGVIHNVFLVKVFFSRIALLLFVLFSVLSLADIRWGEKLVEDERSGYEVVLVLDISRSMLAQDVKPSRIDRMLPAIKRFASESGDTRFAVVVFKGKAHRILPMTGDLHSLDLILSSLGPGMMTSAGSNLEEGIRAALASFQDTGKYQAILLFSDGESLSGDPEQAASEAGRKGIPVMSVAVGTERGDRIVLKNGETVLDRKGENVISRMDLTTLDSIAQASGGKRYSLDQLSRLRTEMLSVLKRMAPGQASEGLKLMKREHSRTFLLLGVGCLLLSLSIRGFRWKDVL